MHNRKKIQESVQKKAGLPSLVDCDKLETMTAKRESETEGISMNTTENGSETAYTVLGTSPYDEARENELADKKIAALENYRFFDAQSIQNSKTFTKKVCTEAQKLIKDGKIRYSRLQYPLYGETGGDIYGRMYFTGNKDGAAAFSLIYVFNKSKVVEMRCGCPDCAADYYYYYSYDNHIKKCPYAAAGLQLLAEYLRTHNLGDRTDRMAYGILNGYEKKKYYALGSEVAQQGELQLRPRILSGAEEQLQIGFKIGTSKLYVVKDMRELLRNLENGADMKFGTKTVLNLNRDNFDEKSTKWLEFFYALMDSEKEMMARLEEVAYYYEESRRKKMFMLLNGSRLDRFFETAGNDTVEYEDKLWGRKGTLQCRTKDPHIVLQIKPEKTEGRRELSGIRVKAQLPQIYQGREHVYYTQDGGLFRMSTEFMDVMKPFFSNISFGTADFVVGRNHLRDFYANVLAEVRDYVDVVEEQPEEIDQYLVPDAEIVFYLDAQARDAFCRVQARYGSKEYPVYHGGYIETEREGFRSAAAEEAALHLAKKWFPLTDPVREAFCCGKDEERIYALVHEGVQELLEFGEVRCTDSFRNLNVVRRVKMSVGVSVESGLMNLEVDTSDISPQELLDILKSYRQKKKYHILKSGEYVDMDDDALAMLNDMMLSMNIPVREFVKGKMHMPLYRALYLDKLLEENEDVYSNRDRNFKSLIKNFKTVTDADFEEPKELSAIMRKYQINGYKWLRTLESYGFGGILADDMGLGKTLQAIAVLLAARQEDAGKTALIITPASLVYNWGCELERFAPQLKTALVTGTQKERCRILEESAQYDVLVTSYDLLKRDIEYYDGKTFYYEIIDEAQYIKNHNTAAAKSVKTIGSTVRFALTGTPIENRLSELWSIFDFLMPGFLFPYETFRTEFELPIVKSGDEDALTRLQKMVRPFILRRLKGDVLKELPDKLEESCYVKMETEQQRIYDAQVVHMKQMLSAKSEEEFAKSRIQVLAELTKLRQICCDPSLCFENYTGESAKLDACIELLNSALEGGHKILLFSQFTSMLAILQNRLQKEKISYYVITGQTSKEERMRLVKHFNEDETQVFLISLKAGGVGLNLTGADVVVHYDPWWNLAAQNQATDRAHRIGQKNTVTVYKMIAKNTIEEKIQKLQEAKKDLADRVLSGTDTGISGMTREDFIELLDA